jgi:4-alpha-glucanotransferase
VTGTATDSSGRVAGLLLPLFSMPSTRSWGVGEFPDIVALEPWMREAGLRVLQVLPLNEMAPGQSSPYSALSAMALDPIFLSVPAIPDFQAMGGEDALDTAERGALAHVRASSGVDYWAVRTLKERALRRAFRHFVEHEWVHDTERAARLRAFIADQSWWLDDYAVFRAAYHLSDGQAWREWNPGMRDREPWALSRLRSESGREVLYRQYLQWTAQTQWLDARGQAAPIRIAGDFPFGVAADSADVWGNQALFSFDGAVGAPPDAFSEEGQNWQLPVYRWDIMRERGYEWFGTRARRTADLFDLFRVDHVVGLFRTWVFPRDERAPHFVPLEVAAQMAQGKAVLRAVIAAGATVIAEDLGTIPGFVRATMRRLGVPGYKVLRWERRWKEPGQPYVEPSTYPALSVTTSGTHDTETLAGWWTGLDERERTAVLDAVEPGSGDAAAALATACPHEAASGAFPRSDDAFVPGVRDALLESLYGSGSDLLTLPLQDVFGWTDRINVPAIVDDRNWTWKLPWPVDRMDEQPEAAERQRALRRWAERHRRL